MGLLRYSRRLVLEQATRTPDGAGGFAEGWAPLGVLWGDIAPASPRQSAPPGADAAKVPLRITLRAAPAGSPRRPLPGQRLREGARVFPVLAVVEPDVTGRTLIVHAHEERSL